MELCQFALRIELGGTAIQSGQFGQGKDLLPLLEFEPQVVQPVNAEYAISVTSLLSPAYKIICSIPLSRLNMHVDEIIGDNQCSFWTNKSISDHIFCLYEILEEKQ